MCLNPSMYSTDSIVDVALLCTAVYILHDTSVHLFVSSRTGHTSKNTGECQQVRIIRRLLAYCVLFYEANDGSVI